MTEQAARRLKARLSEISRLALRIITLIKLSGDPAAIRRQINQLQEDAANLTSEDE
jgi:hypothetical protein